MLDAVEKVYCENHDGNEDQKAGNRHHNLGRVKLAGIIIHDAAAHPQKADAHHPEGQNEEGGGHQPSGPAPEFIHTPPGGFGEPVVERCKEWEDKSTKIVSWKWPTIKYVSVRCRSVETVAFGGPETHEEDNDGAEDKEHRRWGFDLAQHIVATHEKNFTPVGIATSRVLYMNGTRRYSFIPEANIWCAQTRKPTRAMPREDIATQR